MEVLSPPPTSPQELVTLVGRPELAQRIKASYQDVCGPQGWLHSHQFPIVYHPRYNITFLGLEKLHPFDSCKFRKVLDALIARGCLAGRQQTVQPGEASLALLRDVHTDGYLHKIHHHNLTIVKVTELAPLFMLPNVLLQRSVVSPMKHHVAGTVLAAGLAMERGWAINIGGGMHHANHEEGMGWCPFDDIMLAVRRLRSASGGAVKRVLVIDLDAHQGNGVERDKLHFQDEDLCILDMYNAQVFPLDEEAKAAIDVRVELKRGTTTDVYLSKLQAALVWVAEVMPSPDLIIYNAGTDVLEGDPLGRLAVSRPGVVQRDELVWRFAAAQSSPLVMLLSGGYAKDSAPTIVDSIANLFAKFDLAIPKRSANL